MKKSTATSCCFLIAAVVMGILAVVMAYFCFLPGLYEGLQIALHLTICLLLILFVLAAFSACHCAKKLAIALCRYGGCFVCALTVSLFATLAMLVIPCMSECLALYLVVLFFAAAAFSFSLLLFAGILYTLVTLGCPHCPPAPPCPKKVCDEPEDYPMF